MKVFGQLEKAQAENTTSDTSSLPKGMITYRTDLNVMKVSDGAIMREVVDTSSAQTLTAKTLTSPIMTGPQVTSGGIIFTQIATPSTPGAGLNKLYFKADKTLYTLDETGVESAVGSGGGGSGKNYLSTVNNINGNGNFELGTTTKWSLFNTTLTSLIPTGSITAGAASITTFSATTSGKLSGQYSLSIAGSGAITAGQGFLTDAVTFDLEDQIKVCSFSFSYKVISGGSNLNFSGTSANTFAVYVYDVTNSAWIQPAGVYSMDQLSGVGKAQGSFQTTGGTQYRLAVICINASGGAASLLFDSFEMGPQKITQGTPVTDWQAYTPIFTGFGTVSSVEFFWRRVGGSIEIRGKALAGTMTGVEARISLPAGLSSDTALVPTIAAAGHWWGGDSLVAHGSVLIESGVSYLTFGTGSTGANAYTKLNGTALIPDAVAIGFQAMLPINGWSSNVTMSADSDTRVVAASYATSAGTSTGAGAAYGFQNKLYDTHSAYNSGSGLYTAPVSGKYHVDARVYTAAIQYLNVYVNGAFVSQGTEGTAATCATISGDFDLKAGDTLAIYTVTAGTTSSGSALTNFTIHRISGPSQIAASETVAAIYEQGSTQSISNSSVTIVDYETKVKDTHGAVTTGAGWKFTAPVSGFYRVSATAALGASATGQRDCYLHVNGVQYSAREYPPTAGSGINCNIDDLVYLNAGEYVDYRINQNSGGSLSTLGANPYNRISIIKEGH